MTTRAQYYVQDDDDAAALIRSYAYLIRRDCRWLAGLPGIDNKRLPAAHKAQRDGELWHVDDIVEACRKQPLTLPTSVNASQRAAA